MEDGRVVLGDFGAARNFSSGTRPLLPDYAQFWPGNYGYISPEVLAGLHGDKPTLAYGADMFALGAIFFEMLTGTMLLPLVFDVTTLAHLQAIGVVQDGKKRQDVYHGIVTALRDGHQLPSVRDVSDDIPKCIRARVDDLCGALVAIDYRERLQDFESLFRRIAVCRLLLKNDKVTQQQLGWRRQRRRALAESGAGAKK
jgi:serine/threonine protein kinase